MRTRNLVTLMTFLTCGVVPACSQPVSDPQVKSVAPAVPASAVSMASVPTQVQRRALRHLDEVRGAGVDWSDASLAAYAVPLLRPDVEGPAYYELSVFGADGTAQGYLIVSTGDHDSPLPLASQRGDSPTARLRAMAGAEPARFYMIDTLTFVAESDDGRMLAKLGSLPDKLTWRSDLANLDESAFEGFSNLEQTASTTPEDRATRRASAIRTAFRPPVPYETATWSSWDEMKHELGKMYAPIQASQAQRAKRAWSREASLYQGGEALAVGDARWIDALEGDAQAPIVSGSGASAVTVSAETLSSGNKGYVVRVVSPPARAGAGVDVTVKYASGREETLKFGVYPDVRALRRNLLVVPGSAPSSALAPNADGLRPMQNPHPCNHQSGQCGTRVTTSWRAAYPEVGFSSGGGQLPDEPTLLDKARKQQPWYGQLDKSDSYNPYDCSSGCGGTAWAMLIGWADNRAADPHSPWHKRWGLYRAELATRSADEVAPLDFSKPGARHLVGAVAGELEAVLAGCRVISDDRFTAPNVMDDITGWIRDRSDVNVHTTYNALGRTSDDREITVEEEIMDHDRPAIAGVGKLKHYVLVFGVEIVSQTHVGPSGSGFVEVRRWRINNGWGSESASDATMDPYAFFVGRIDPDTSGDADDYTPLPPPECPVGATEHRACPSGTTGTGYERHCVKGRWLTSDYNCAKPKPGNPGGGGAAQDPK